ncbi:hypothetical protein [Qipengyuania sp. 902]|uniref:hypothetical protein n=1 Tax=Qipengyuania sp. 902 TaxID=3417565 RepID=UPI003EBED7BA
MRALNREIRRRIASEHQLVQDIVRDAETRAALLAGHERTVSPLRVWTNFDHSSCDLTSLSPTDLPQWRDVGEYLKLHLLAQLGIWTGGYAFTVKIRPDLEAKWKREGIAPMDRIKRNIAERLAAEGLSDLEYCYVVETRSKSGKSRSQLHLHGVFIAEDVRVATKFKVVMERALALHPKGRAAAGVKPKAGPAINIQPLYEKIDGSRYGRGRWAGYAAKNVHKPDTRFTRRFFMSRAATRLVREFWALILEEPLPQVDL